MSEVRLYNSAVGKRNAELRELLIYVAQQGTIIGIDIESQFNWARARVNKALVELTARKFLSAEYEICSRGKRLRYALLPYTTEQLDKELPISKEMAELYGNNRKGVGRFGSGKPKPEKTPGIFRDPLDVYLMGTGVAPSILFHRSQHA